MGEHRKALFRALEKSDLNMLRVVLAEGVSPSLEAGDRMPPLMEAINCDRNDVEILDELLRAGADITQRFLCGDDTILHWATGRETPAVLNWCLANGAAVDARDARGWTPLMRALFVACQPREGAETQACGLRDIGLLLGAGANIALANNEGRNALHYAAEFGHAQALALLIHHGAPIDAQDAVGMTALMIAAKKGWAGIVSLLLDAGADTEIGDRNGQTALHLIAGFYPDATEPGHVAAAEALLNAGAGVNALDSRGLPALCGSAGNGNAVLVRLLLRHGANVELGAGEILHDAVFFEHDDVLTVLLEAGADVHVDIGEAYGCPHKTVLHVAAHEGYLFGVNRLLDHGASVDAADIDGETPLMTAVRRQHIDIVQVLLDAGADIRRADHYGNTPLSLARRRGNAELIALLESAMARMGGLSG